MWLPLVAAIVLGSPAARVQTVTVFAAASLKEALGSIAKSFEVAHPGTHVNLSFAGSQTLAAQIVHGAPADVFASASMRNLEDSRPVPSSIRVFAQNRLTVVVRKSFRSLRSLRDLGGVPRIVLADSSVPAGKYAESFLVRAGKAYGAGWAKDVRSRVVSREIDVRAVLTKVRLGEADAGIVYVTDAISARGEVSTLAIPDSLNQIATYPVGLTSRAPNRAGGNAFIDYLFTSESQASLERYGFISPLRSVTKLLIMQGGKTRSETLPLSAALGHQSVRIVRGGHAAVVSGTPVSKVIGKFSGQVVFISADGQTVTRTTNSLIQSRAVFVREKDGNYTLFAPGPLETTRLSWIRRIELK